jgi:hypothetical protein
MAVGKSLTKEATGLIGASPHPTNVLSSRPLTKLLPKASETALINHVVKWHPLWEQGRRLNTQVKPLDIDLAVGAIACNDQKAEPVDMALEIPIGLLAGLHDAYTMVAPGISGTLF